MSECEWCNRGLPIGDNGEHYRPQNLGDGQTLLCAIRARQELTRAQRVVEAVRLWSMPWNDSHADLLNALSDYEDGK